MNGSIRKKRLLPDPRRLLPIWASVELRNIVQGRDHETTRINFGARDTQLQLGG
jgi:hypothetical protein